jgi:hypothetical protein
MHDRVLRSVLYFGAYHSVPLRLTDIVARLSFFPVHSLENLVEDVIRGGRTSRPLDS